MSLSTLAYLQPAFRFLQLTLQVTDWPFNKLKKLSDSKHSDAIKQIISEVLHKENVEGTEYFDRIQHLLEKQPVCNESAIIRAVQKSVLEDLLQEISKNKLMSPTDIIKERLDHLDTDELQKEAAALINQPYTQPPKTIDSLLHTRFKILDIEGQLQAQTCASGLGKQKFFIEIGQGIDEGALPFIAKHELSHILNEDVLDLAGVQFAVSLATSIFTSWYLEWSPLYSIATTFAADALAFIALSQFKESKADDFAIQHSSIEELQKAIEFHKLRKKAFKEKLTYKTYFKNNLIKFFTHPPTDWRIAKIQKAIDARQRTGQVPQLH